MGKSSKDGAEEFNDALMSQQNALKNHKDIMSAEEEELAEKRKEIEEEFRDKLFDLRASETEKLEKEYNEQIASAKRAGASTQDIEEYYSMKRLELARKENEELYKRREEDKQYIIDIMKDEMEIEQETYDRRSAILDSWIEERQRKLEKTKESIASGAVDILDGPSLEDTLEYETAQLDEALKAREKLEEDHNKKKKELNSKWIQDVKNTISQIETIYNTFVGTIADVFGSINEISKMSLDNELVELKNVYGAMLEETTKMYGKQYDELEQLHNDRLISTREYNKRKEDLQKKETEETNRIQEEQNEKEVALKKRVFDADKKLKIAQVWTDFGRSIMTLWAAAWNLGPIAGPIFAGIMTGVMAGIAGTQTGLIANQQFPQYAAGGDFDAGPAIVGEKGAELAFFKQPGHIYSHEDSKKMMSSGDFNFTIQGDIKSEVDLERMMQRMNSMYRSRQRGIAS
jgi:hypothetical protein